MTEAFYHGQQLFTPKNNQTVAGVFSGTTYAVLHITGTTPTQSALANNTALASFGSLQGYPALSRTATTDFVSVGVSFDGTNTIFFAHNGVTLTKIPITGAPKYPVIVRWGVSAAYYQDNTLLPLAQQPQLTATQLPALGTALPVVIGSGYNVLQVAAWYV